MSTDKKYPLLKKNFQSENEKGYEYNKSYNKIVPKIAGNYLNSSLRSNELQGAKKGQGHSHTFTNLEVDSDKQS